MSLVVRGTDLIGLPVVTLDGDDLAEVKDVVLALTERGLLGFTLRGRGMLSGPMEVSLPWPHVHAVGRDAVMVRGADALDHGELRAERDGGEDVIDIQVLADDGNHLGVLTDVVLALGITPEVVGFEMSEPQRDGAAFLPVDEMVSVSERALVVPAAARGFLHDDLSGFGAGVDQYRAQLREGS